MNIKYIDIHSHIHDGEFYEDQEEIVARMKEVGVATITVGTHINNSREALALSEKEKLVFATVGLHPTDTKEGWNQEEYLSLAKNNRVVAIGECGLDYFRGADDEEKKRQREIFISQIELALLVDKPLMIHGRPSLGSMDAYLDIIEILFSYKNYHKEKLRGNIHFFSGSMEIAQKFLDLGFSMSFTGVITFTNDYDEVVKFLPLSSVMIETDAPYATPVPYRGKRNDPIYVKEVVKRIAKIRGEEEEFVAETILKNTLSSFNLQELFD